MTLDIRIAAPATRRLELPKMVSRAYFHWRGRDGLIDAPLTGHIGTLTRASTRTAIDGLGTTYTASYGMPGWESRDFLSSGTRDHLGLRLTADDLSYLPENGTDVKLPTLSSTVEMTLFVRLSEAGTRTTANAGLFYSGNDAASGARLYLDSNGTNYRVVHHNGTSSVNSILASATPTSGNGAILRAEFRGNGSVQLGLSTNFTSETLATASGTLTPAAFPSACKHRVNRIGSAGTQGDVWIGDILLLPGLQTLATGVALML